MQDYSDQEKNIYCGFNSRFVITKEDRNQAIGKEFLKMETRYRKKELNLVVAHNTLQQLIGGAFFKIENNGSEIFIESFFIRNISDKEAFKLLYKNMIIAMGGIAPNALKIRIKARTVPGVLESTVKDLGLKYNSNKREWIHEAIDQPMQQEQQVLLSWCSPLITFVSWSGAQEKHN